MDIIIDIVAAMVLRPGGGSRHKQQRQVERRPSDQARGSTSSHVNTDPDQS